MLWEKEKMFVTDIFSISHNVFKSLTPQVVKTEDCLLNGSANGLTDVKKIYYMLVATIQEGCKYSESEVLLK